MCGSKGSVGDRRCHALLTADPDDAEVEIVENITRDDVFAKLEETQKTVARLNLGEDEDTAQADQAMEWPESAVT